MGQLALYSPNNHIDHLVTKCLVHPSKEYFGKNGTFISCEDTSQLQLVEVLVQESCWNKWPLAMWYCDCFIEQQQELEYVVVFSMQEWWLSKT